MTLTSSTPLSVLLACDRLGHEVGNLHGAGRCMLEWTRGLLERGVRVTPVILRASAELRARVETEHLPFVFLNRTSLDARTVLDFASLIRRNQVHVLHLQGYGSCFFGRIAALLMRVPTIVHVHADYRYGPKGYPLHVRMADRLLARSTDRVFAVSQQVREFAITVQGFEPARVEVLHNPVDGRRFHPPSPEQKAGARRIIGTPPKSVLAVYVGRLDRWKGVDVLLNSWSAVLCAVPHAVLLIVGDGPMRGALEDQAGSAPWASSVQFLGHCIDVEQILWAADVAVMPSRQEGLGLVLLEAMSTGLPVVGTRVGGIPEMVRSGKNGMLVPADDDSALATALTTLLTDGQARRRLGEGAVQSAADHDLPRFAERLEAVYRSLRKVIDRTPLPMGIQ